MSKKLSSRYPLNRHAHLARLRDKNRGADDTPFILAHAMCGFLSALYLIDNTYEYAKMCRAITDYGRDKK